ncbi:hypothetical protein Tco_0630628, partial [Tanacetum coccineum]
EEKSILPIVLWAGVFGNYGTGLAGQLQLVCLVFVNQAMLYFQKIAVPFHEKQDTISKGSTCLLYSDPLDIASGVIYAEEKC